MGISVGLAVILVLILTIFYLRYQFKRHGKFSRFWKAMAGVGLSDLYGVYVVPAGRRRFTGRRTNGNWTRRTWRYSWTTSWEAELSLSSTRDDSWEDDRWTSLSLLPS